MEFQGGMMNCSDAQFLVKKDSIRVTVGVTCILSMIGALLVMISFLCFRTLRSRTRFILFNIALTDFFVALANFVGDVANFDKHYINITSDEFICQVDSYGIRRINPQLMTAPSSLIETLCVSQAFVALFSTLSSVLWTIALAVYLYFAITQSKTRKAYFSIWFSFIFSYTLPLMITLWMLLTSRLGYSPYDAAGWCSMIIYDPKTNHVDRYLAVFGYDLWIYLTMFLILIIYLGLRFFLAEWEHRTSQFVTQKKFWDSVHTMDYKFMMIPISFILLRMWSCIIDILMYAGVDIHSIPWGITLALLILSGIGDSGQGMVNGLLFVILTKPVRQQMLNAISCKWRKITFDFDKSVSPKKPIPDEKTPFFSSHEEINNP